MSDTYHPPELGTWRATSSRTLSQRAADRHAVLSALAESPRPQGHLPWRLRRARPVVVETA